MKKDAFHLCTCMKITCVSTRLYFSNVKGISTWWSMSDYIRKLLSLTLPSDMANMLQLLWSEAVQINCWEKFGSHSSQKETYILKEHNKSLQTQRKFEAKLENAQLSAGQQIDNRIDQNLAGLDAKVKSIIKDTVKPHSIKRDAIEFDQSLLECDLTRTDSNYRYPQSASASSTPSAPHSKKARNTDYIDLRSPSNSSFLAQGPVTSEQQTSGYNRQRQGFKCFIFKKTSSKTSIKIFLFSHQMLM